ncbi:L-asparaginase [Sanguibacter gelidistatuariae]|uniref:L-asparaginase n=1 Tax=Sanguibacter gelidistatuariae TaxID=1814289 RepID=A0A1G6H7Y1_9MICO|nr:asparaginase domain-containing protein [Sanguibacter gelidistatuariae]SDB89556.1 L-asparaginase [Sanguibacter gelidistatuariae]
MTTIALITLGGTISSESTGAGLGVVPVTGADLMCHEIQAWVPETNLIAHEFRLLPSASITLADLLELHAFVAALPGDVDAVVVSQGTDTIEETAFVLDVLGTAARIPVVVTGAMRNRASAGADGPANLVAAVLVAASPDARGMGVLVQFADVVHAARWVRKASTFHVDAFSSDPLGPVGLVSEGRAHVELVPRTRPVLAAPAHAGARIAHVSAGVSDDLALLPALAAAGYDGVVLAGVGGGHVAADAVRQVALAAAVLPIVLCSRIGSGPSPTATYGYPGGEIDLLARGLIPGRMLSPVKARLLLALLLGSGLRGDALRAAFDVHAR